MLRSALAAAALAAVSAFPAGADVLARLAAGEPLRLAVREDARPLSWMEGAAPAGYSVAVCQEVAKRLAKAADLEGVRFAYLPVTAETRFDAVADGAADLLCGAATVTLARRELVEFSMATFVDGAGVLAGPDAPSDFRGFAGRRIGVRGATTTEDALRNTLAALDMQAEVVAAESHQAGLDALLAGETDAYFADRSILFGLLADPRAGELRMADEMLTIERHALALPKGDAALRREVDRALSGMFRDGTMRRIFAQTFPGASPGQGLGALWLLGGLPD